jgi:tetratricopeptide (TPR) repeat protein
LTGAAESAVLVQSAQSAKNALILLQGQRIGKGLPRAYRLLGETELARERINEAIDYFGFAAESAESSDEQYEALLSSVNGICTQFLLGNLSSALRHAQKAEERAETLYLSDWYDWARFMKGRIRFEVGDYDQAAELFDALAFSGKAVALFRNWRDRALVYENPTTGIFFVDASDDAPFFRLEAAFLLNEFEQVVRMADDYLSRPEPSHFRNPERVDWSSGFALVENRAVGLNGVDRVYRRISRTYRALSLSNLGAAADATAELHRIAKEEPLSGWTPTIPFIFGLLQNLSMWRE